jgi:hypothetical protein
LHLGAHPLQVGDEGLTGEAVRLAQVIKRVLTGVEQVAQPRVLLHVAELHEQGRAVAAASSSPSPLDRRLTFVPSNSHHSPRRKLHGGAEEDNPPMLAWDPDGDGKGPARRSLLLGSPRTAGPRGTLGEAKATR